LHLLRVKRQDIFASTLSMSPGFLRLAIPQVYPKN
jgi:hypothetical protein